jgi:hypothetical protein
VRLGSWRDREVARDAKVTAALGGLVFFLLALPEGLASILALLAILASVTAILMHFRGGSASASGGPAERPHRGPNMSRIPMAGFPGLVFAVGFVWMFWSGVPTFRPIVIAMGVCGLIGGVILVIVRTREDGRSSTLLGLRSDKPSEQSRPDR